MNCSGGCLICNCVLTTGRQAEIADLHVRSGVNEDIFGFQIAMNDIQAMNVSKALENLSEQAPYLVVVFVQPSLDDIS
jgi:hypothetical protein